MADNPAHSLNANDLNAKADSATADLGKDAEQFPWEGLGSHAASPPIPSGLNVLLHRPRLLWLTIALIPFCIGGIAMTLLMSPDLSRQTSSPTDGTSDVPTIPSPPLTEDGEVGGDSATLPLWALGAIAASCALGCFAISQQLRLSSSASLLEEEGEEELSAEDSDVCLCLPSFLPSPPADSPPSLPTERLPSPTVEESNTSYHHLISAWLRSRQS